VHDCQYSDEEYPDHVGWGHSPLSDALTFARRVEAQRVLMFHHDPLHTDDWLDSFSGTASQRWAQMGGDPAALELAVERREIELGRTVAPAAGAPAG
jgi:phosphoribosyl 1,2-cyclic phosphodiesterase